MIDENLKKLLAAEKEGEAIIAEACRKAESIANKNKIAIINLAERKKELLDQLQTKEENKLKNLLGEMKKSSEARIKTICAEIDKKMAMFTEKAVTEIERDILQ